MPKIFASATSRDLKSYRKVVAEWGGANGHAIIVQDEFEVMSDYGTIVHMLRDKLDPCDAVIHLAGLLYGFEPTNRPDGEARRSYTQLEYELGKEHKRQVFRFIARPDYAPDNPIAQENDKAELQLQHRARLMTRDQLYYEFSNHAELRALLDKLQIQATLAKPQNLPLVGSLFKGRDEFLDQLRSVLVNKPTHIAAVTAKQAIHGLGGVGKTRVAVEYAKRYSHDYTALLFITADSGANLKSNLANLCGSLVLNLPEKDAREQEVQVAAAVRWLREHSGWFLIVDNVDTPEAATVVEDLMEKLDTGHVVITSRLSQWGGAVQELALDVLTEQNAKALLFERTAGKRRPAPTDEADARELAKDLGCLPLALEQAGAFIVEDGCSFADYRTLWKAHDNEVLTWHSHLMKYPRSVATTWQTSFDKVGTDGQGLLSVLCWLAPEPIPLAMLEKLDPTEWEPAFNWKKGRRDLARYSFVKWSDDTNTAIVVHRLVQEITEYRIPEGEKLGCLQGSSEMLDAFCSVNAYDVRTWKEVCTPAQPHVLAVARLADGMGIAYPTISLMIQASNYLLARSDFASAETLLRRALVVAETSDSPDCPAVAICLNTLAQVLRALHRPEETEPLIRRALAIYESAYGPEGSAVANPLRTLARLLASKKQYVEAESHFRRALAIDEASEDAGRSNVAESLRALANFLIDIDRAAEAEPMVRKAVTIEETRVGSEHPNVALSLVALADWLQKVNRVPEAEPHLRRALAIQEANYGPDHANVANLMKRLGSLLYRTDRSSEAEPLLRKALAIYAGRNELDTSAAATVFIILSLALQETGRHAEAEMPLLRGLAIDEQIYGPDHPYVANALHLLGRLLLDLKRDADAEALLRRALSINEQSFEHDYSKLAHILRDLGLLLMDTDRHSEAERLLRRAAESTVRLLGAEHPSSAAAVGNYTCLLQSIGRSEAEIATAIASIQAEVQATVGS